MSLDAAQRARTAQEFSDALAAAGLDREGLRQLTGLPAGRLDAALEVREQGADPVDVWAVRDALESAVLRSGGDAPRFTVLTEQMRSAAGSWFGVRDRR